MNNLKTETEIPSLSLDDLESLDVTFDELTREDAIGIPELGASYGIYGCCSSGCM